MNLLYQIFASWRDPAVKAQRDWVFLQFWGRTSNQRIWWFLGFLLLLCFMWLSPVDQLTAIYLSIGLLAYAHAFNVAEVIAAFKKWRLCAAQLQIVIAQALLLYVQVWSLLGLMILYRTANATLLLLLSSVQLIALLMSLVIPQSFDKKDLNVLHAPRFQGQAIWVVLMPIFLLMLFPQYEALIRHVLLVASIGLLLAVIWLLSRFGRPQKLAKVELPQPHVNAQRQQAKHPLLLRLEMHMGGALDRKGLRKIVVSLFLVPYAFILLYQHLLPASLAISQWGAGALFAVLTPSFLGLFTGRRQWSGSWLVRSHSRAQLWWQDEQLFLSTLLLTAALNCALLLVLQIDTVNNILNAALLFVFGLASLRYLIFSVEWMSLWSLSADGRATQSGFSKTMICLMPAWVGLTVVWGSGVQSHITMMIMAFALAASILAYVSYRKALKINLGAIRRVKRS